GPAHEVLVEQEPGGLPRVLGMVTPGLRAEAAVIQHRRLAAGELGEQLRRARDVLLLQGEERLLVQAPWRRHRAVLRHGRESAACRDAARLRGIVALPCRDAARLRGIVALPCRDAA